MVRIFLILLITTVNLYCQTRDEIYKIGLHNYGTTYSYNIDVLTLSGENIYYLSNQEYLSKKLMKKNVIFNYRTHQGIYEREGDTLHLKENESGKKMSFIFLSKNKLVRLIEGREKSKYIWKKVDY